MFTFYPANLLNVIIWGSFSVYLNSLHSQSCLKIMNVYFFLYNLFRNLLLVVYVCSLPYCTDKT